MGDDIGMWNIGAHHRGMIAGRTPNLDQIAKGGKLFTDYYAEASCTAGRANFITGELPIWKERPSGTYGTRPTPGVHRLAPDVAVTAGRVDFSDGVTVTPFRVTWVLQRRDGAWRIAHHRGSTLPGH